MPSLSKMPVSSMEKLQCCVVEAIQTGDVQEHLEENFLEIVLGEFTQTGQQSCMKKPGGVCQSLSCVPAVVSDNR